jgi:hypothetical protein
LVASRQLNAAPPPLSGTTRRGAKARAFAVIVEGDNAMTEIKEHMSIVGKDGVPVGAVDHVEGDRIKLTKKDNPPGHEGHHHYIDKKLVGSIEGDVIKLTVNGDAAPRTEKSGEGV